MNCLKISNDVYLTARCLRTMGPVIEAALELWPDTIDGYVWITSAFRDGDLKLHGRHSAIDLRVWNILRWKEMDESGRQNLVNEVGGELRARISEDYDVDPHPELVMTQPHIHVEDDPKE